MTRLKLTNRLGLPLPIVEAVENDDYDPGKSDYTATSLLQPARMRRLLQIFPVETVEDVADCLYRLHGKSVHLILERAAKRLEAEGFVVEKRFYGKFTALGREYLVSAQVDLFDPAKASLHDYKATSVAALSKGLKDEHMYQMNLQAELLRRAGFQVETAEIVGIFRDWSASRAASNSESYPQEPVAKQSVPLLLPQEVDAWVAARIVEHEGAKLAKDQGVLPLCSDEETWARVDDDSFTVTKEGASRASKVCATEVEAKDYVASRPGQGLRVERRFGAATRCQLYCAARSVCAQWKSSPRNPANAVGSGTKKQGNVTTPLALPDGFEKL